MHRTSVSDLTILRWRDFETEDIDMHSVAIIYGVPED